MCGEGKGVGGGCGTGVGGDFLPSSQALVVCSHINSVCLYMFEHYIGDSKAPADGAQGVGGASYLSSIYNV